MEDDRDREAHARAERIRARRPTHFTSTISDERGDELTYNGRAVSDYIAHGDIARVIANLWLKRDVPDYALGFIRYILILLADHGPAVSGATNAIVTARAGRDMVSSLIAGLATIGPRFGGAIDGAGRHFFESVRGGVTPEAFVATMKRSGERIPGIGHRVKSKFRPDSRCTILLEYSEIFPVRRHLAFARAVEALTLEKKPNLILKVDGTIAAMLLDLLADMGFTDTEVARYLDAGLFNAFFILSRTIGFLGHIIDQKMLGEGLYRTDTTDILYL